MSDQQVTLQHPGGTLDLSVVPATEGNDGLDISKLMSATGFVSVKGLDFSEAMRRIAALPGVERVSAGMTVPWRDTAAMPRFQFAVDGYTPAEHEERLHARFRVVAPRFFSVVGVPLIAGREFTDADNGRQPVVIVSQSIAQRLFPNGEALNRNLWWTDPLVSLLGKPIPNRIVGVVADVEDENVAPGPALTVYTPTGQMGGAAQHLFVRAAGNPYVLVPEVTHVIRQMSADQPVERAATLEDVRAQMLSPDRLNAFVISGFAGIALLIAVVGVAGVLAFSVSARTREFGIRLAVGASPAQLMARVISEGVGIAAFGIATGAFGGYAIWRLALRFVEPTHLPGALPVASAAAVLIAAAVIASMTPAARASRVDVVQALRSE